MSYRPTISVYVNGKIADIGYYRNWDNWSIFVECLTISTLFHDCKSVEEYRERVYGTQKIGIIISPEIWDNTDENLKTLEWHSEDPFIVDLTHKCKKNNGEVPQYYVENDHEAIIKPAVFDLVQAEIERRNQHTGKYSGNGIFSSKIKCGCCGNWYGSKVWHSNDRHRKTVYRCNHKYKNNEKCTTPHLTEEEIKLIFIKAVNVIISTKDSVLEDALIIRNKLCDTTDLEKDSAKLAGDMEIVADLIEKHVRENASTVINQADYQARYDELVERYNIAKAEYEEVQDKISARQNKALEIDHFISEIKKHDEFIDEFDGAMWSSLVEHITVHSKKKIIVKFRDGTSIPIK